MKKETIYSMVKSQQYLPGSIRWRVGSINENEDRTDRTRFTTPDGRVYVIEYHTFEEGQKTFSDVYDVIEINPGDQILKG